MNKEQYLYNRQKAKDIKRLWPIKEALQLLEYKDTYYITNQQQSFKARLNKNHLDKLI